MQRFSVRLLIACSTFFVGVAVAAGWSLFRTPTQAAPDSQQASHVTTSNAGNPSAPPWGRILYRHVDWLTTPAGLTALRSAPVPQGDLDVRVWLGFGLTPLEGFILKRDAGQWSALHLKGDDYSEPKKVQKMRLTPPPSGWDSFWERLVGAGVRTLPDSSEIDYDAGGLDGWAYLVELREGGSYRAFHYQLPEYSRRPEARQVLEIGNAIGDEFKLPSFKEKDVRGR